MDNRIFDVRTNVNVCNCTGRYSDTDRESALKVDSGRKIPCRIGHSNVRQRRASPTLYQVSCIPTPLIGLMMAISVPNPSDDTNSPDPVCYRRVNVNDPTMAENAVLAEIFGNSTDGIS